MRKYLKSGNELGWCTYCKEEAKIMGQQKSSKTYKQKYSRGVRVYKDGVLLGTYDSTIELDRVSVSDFGTKFYHSGISHAARGEIKSYKGYVFEYIREGRKKAS